MKVSRILFGLGVGAVAGFAVALRHRDDQSVKKRTIDTSQPTGAQSELQREIENMKQSFNDILNYGSQIKNESIEFGSSTLTSPALEDISVLSFDSVAFEPQAPNKSALAVTGTIILFINFIS